LRRATAGDKQLGWRIETRETQPVWVAACREKIRSNEEADDLFGEVERRIGAGLLAGKPAANRLRSAAIPAASG